MLKNNIKAISLKRALTVFVMLVIAQLSLVVLSRTEKGIYYYFLVTGFFLVGYLILYYHDLSQGDF